MNCSYRNAVAVLGNHCRNAMLKSNWRSAQIFFVTENLGGPAEQFSSATSLLVFRAERFVLFVTKNSLFPPHLSRCSSFLSPASGGLAHFCVKCNVFQQILPDNSLTASVRFRTFRTLTKSYAKLREFIFCRSCPQKVLVVREVYWDKLETAVQVRWV